MFKIIVVGISADEIGSEARCRLEECRCIVAASRFQPLAEEFGQKIIPITPFRAALEAIEKHLAQGDVGVLASGDPLFFGIGRRLVEEFGAQRIVILPALSSMQLACARFKIPWDNLPLVSLHGRRSEHVALRLLPHPRVAVLTDGSSSPDRVAGEMIRYLDLVGAENIRQAIRMHVAENLGERSERLVEGSLEEIAAARFAHPNIVIITRPSGAARTSGALGLTEQEISHCRGLITKDEVRAVVLHKLRLPDEGVFWDIGSGSGSVSIEVARLRPDLSVFAMEKDERRLMNICRNIKIFETFNVLPVGGVAPESSAALPAPERVFVGGSGGDLDRILVAAVERLQEEGRIVVNCVTVGTADKAPEILARQGLRVEMSKVSVSRWSGHEKAEMIDFNPITIVTGKK